MLPTSMTPDAGVDAHVGGGADRLAGRVVDDRVDQRVLEPARALSAQCAVLVERA